MNKSGYNIWGRIKSNRGENSITRAEIRGEQETVNNQMSLSVSEEITVLG